MTTFRVVPCVLCVQWFREIAPREPLNTRNAQNDTEQIYSLKKSTVEDKQTLVDLSEFVT
jgi:hypothetical protein